MDLVNTHTHTHSTMTFNGMNGFLSSITQQQQQTVIKYNTPLYIMMYIYFFFFWLSIFSAVLYHHVWACYECLLWRDIWQKHKWCGMYCEYYTWYGILHGGLYVCVCVERELLLVETDFIHYYNIQSFFFNISVPAPSCPTALFHIHMHDATPQCCAAYSHTWCTLANLCGVCVFVCTVR